MGMLIVPLKAIRTHHLTGKVNNVVVDAQILSDHVRIYGGPTGWESFTYRNRAESKAQMCRDGWYACAGNSVWDKLYIPAESCTELWAFIDAQSETQP